MREIYKLMVILYWAICNPGKALSLYARALCPPLWRWFYRRRIEARAQQENADRMLLSSFRQKLAESDLPYRLHIIGSTRAKLIRTADEVEIVELKIVNEHNNLWILLPREIM